MDFRLGRLATLLTVLLLGSGSVASSAPVSGVVLRAPAAQKQTAGAERYRSRHATAQRPDEQSGAGCNCNPGEFAVVHLTGDNLPPLDLSMQPPTMAQKDRTFEPSVVAIPKGGSVSFPNEDPFFHNVFSYSKARSFDLGRYPKGETHDVTFEKPGIVPVFCEIHYSMRAYIHVLETPYFAVSDLSRRFEIPDVAPGDYVLHVWQENLPEITIPIRVEDEPVEIQVQ